MARRAISPAVKEAVLLALQNPEVRISELAKLHGVSVPIIYVWRKAALVTAAPVVGA